jgi:hypothetical protein
MNDFDNSFSRHDIGDIDRTRAVSRLMLIAALFSCVLTNFLSKESVNNFLDEVLLVACNTPIPSIFQDTDKMTHPTVKELFQSLLNDSQFNDYEKHSEQFTHEVMHDFLKKIELIRQDQIKIDYWFKNEFKWLELELRTEKAFATFQRYRILKFKGDQI